MHGTSAVSVSAIDAVVIIMPRWCVADRHALACACVRVSSVLKGEIGLCQEYGSVL